MIAVEVNSDVNVDDIAIFEWATGPVSFTSGYDKTRPTRPVSRV